MTDDKAYSLLTNALKGINAHVHPANALEDLTVETSGKIIKGSPHTIWQILKHINYWQEKFNSYVKDEFTLRPVSAKEGWDFPASPENDKELKEVINYFNESLKLAMSLDENELKNKAKNYKTGYDVLQGMAFSYLLPYW
jgi:hypothetical protein